jgi:protein TonB
MPRRAIQAGIGGVVRAQATIRDGLVREVVILAGPRELHAAVREAMLQYKCIGDSPEIRAVQEFDFKID